MPGSLLSYGITKEPGRYLSFTSDRGVPWYVHTRLLSVSGVMGNAQRGSAEKGRKR